MLMCVLCYNSHVKAQILVSLTLKSLVACCTEVKHS